MKAKVADIELYYEVHGGGEPIIFDHGMWDDCSVWNSQIQFFETKHKVIAYDHRGHGRSDKPKGNYSIQTLADDLYSLIQELNLEKVTLVAHSTGGMAALLFALNHPDKISKLVLVGSAARLSAPQSFMLMLWYILPYKTFVRLMTRNKYYKPSQQVLEHALDMALNVPRHVAYECWKELANNYDTSRSLYRINVPTFITVGKKDMTMSVGKSLILNKRIQGSELRIIPDCGHMVMLEKPDELNQVLDEFIKIETN